MQHLQRRSRLDITAQELELAAPVSWSAAAKLVRLSSLLRILHHLRELAVDTYIDKKCRLRMESFREVDTEARETIRTIDRRHHIHIARWIPEERIP